ncbi:MAG: hypothetical protein H7Z10_07255 [Gemmatimonadaceae bacterium]|nr:hypothetical protein [Acetobacteraceae bacterium]
MFKQFARSLLIGLTVLGGVAAAVSDANAATRVAGPVPVLSGSSAVESVQYYDDWRHREWRRREAFERFQRREARREWRHHNRGYRQSYNRYNGW